MIVWFQRKILPFDRAFFDAPSQGSCQAGFSPDQGSLAAFPGGGVVTRNSFAVRCFPRGQLSAAPFANRACCGGM